MIQLAGLSSALVLSALVVPTVTPAQQTIAESKPVTISATIEAIDKDTRMVTLKGPKGNSVPVKAPADMQGFNTLKVGDVVSATYFESLAVRIRKPGDPAPATTASTTTQRKELTPGSETRREQTVSVTVEAIDAATPSITVKGPQGRVLTFRVENPKLLQNVKVGDTVDVTYFEALFIKVGRAPK